MNISEKLHRQHLFKKPEEAESHSNIFLNMIALGSTTIFSFGYQSCTNPSYTLVHSVNRTHVLVVIQWNSFGCYSWIYFLSTLFQHQTNLLHSQDSEEVTYVNTALQINIIPLPVTMNRKIKKPLVSGHNRTMKKAWHSLCK